MIYVDQSYHLNSVFTSILFAMNDCKLMQNLFNA